MSSNFVSDLPEDLAVKAAYELNETQVTREEGLTALRRLIKDKGLKTREENANLIRFLRARKFNFDKAFRMLESYTGLKEREPELFSARGVDTSLYPEGGLNVLEGRDRNGAAILILKPGLYTLRSYKSPPKAGRLTVEEIFRLNMVALELCSMEPPTQVAGIVVILDLAGYSLTGHALYLSPYYTKRTTGVLQETFPLRFKGLHVLNQPRYFNALYAIVRPFFKYKMKERVRLHGSSMESLHKFISPEVLPEEYGGVLNKSHGIYWRTTLAKGVRILTDFEEEHL